MKTSEHSHSSPYPILTPSVLADLPKQLREILKESSADATCKNAILVSSNRLANRFIFERWGIRPSQKRRYKELFSSLRQHCRILLQHILMQQLFEWNIDSGRYSFGVFKYDLVRGNLILGFTNASTRASWFMRQGAL